MKLIPILLILILFNCFSLFNKGIISPLFDDKKEIEKYKNETSSCDANSYDKLYFNKLELKTTSEKLRTPSAFMDIMSGYYGAYYFYPNGLKMLLSVLTVGISDFVTHDNHPVKFIGWQYFKNCDSKEKYFFNHELKYTIELDFSLRENFQLRSSQIGQFQDEYKKKCIKHLPKLKEDFYLSMVFDKDDFYYNSNYNNFTENQKLVYEELKKHPEKLNLFKERFLEEIKKENLDIHTKKYIYAYPKGNYLDCEVSAFTYYKNGMNHFYDKYLLPELE